MYGTCQRQQRHRDVAFGETLNKGKFPNLFRDLPRGLLRSATANGGAWKMLKQVQQLGFIVLSGRA